MKKDIFINHLDYVYNLVNEEYQRCQEGKSSYQSYQLKLILKELKSMRFWLNPREFKPYYAHVIVDEWEHNDPLETQLLNLNYEYGKL